MTRIEKIVDYSTLHPNLNDNLTLYPTLKLNEKIDDNQWESKTSSCSC